MNKIKINTNIPAYLTDFTSTENEKFTRAKLKVFYIGETADHRLFPEKFSKKVIKTLPYTPVVSKYDVEKEDFVGHAAQQNIYGIVDPLIQPTFEEIDGQTWAVCGVVLYTERPDETGTIAQKIIGKPHSLELDPKTIQYKLNYDEHRKLKNIEFTDGAFVGVSVLGDDQQPAFTGSGFFSVDADFMSKMDLLKNFLKNCAEENRMEANTLNFVELSWGEKTTAIYKALDQMYGAGNTWIIDNYDDYVVSYLYHVETGETELVKVNYSFDDNGECTLGTVVKVRVVYEEVVEPNGNATVEPTATEEPLANAQSGEEGTSSEGQAEENGLTNAAEIPNASTEGGAQAEETAPVENPENASVETSTEGQPVAPVENPAQAENQPTAEQTTTTENTFSAPTVNEPNTEDSNEQGNTSTFTESERQQFEALKRNEKVELINSYASDLGEEIVNKYLAEVDNFSKDELELVLLKQYREMEKTAKKPIKAFRMIDNNNNINRPRSIEELVNLYK